MLVYLCKVGIRMYWYLIPKEKRIVCLYRDHCSLHVYTAFDERGFVAGIKALVNRYNNCNNRYTYYLEEDRLYIKTAGGEVLDEDVVSPLVVKGCRYSLVTTDK